jgi:hypothetical protein
MNVLPSITTITPGKWRDKIEEIRELKLETIALFPTCLNEAQRRELYALLQKTNVKKIPFVHLRSDMELWELDLLVKTYGTAAFNIHTQKEHPLLHNYGKYKKIICIENNYGPFDEKEVKEFGGTCLDVSHLENDRILHPEVYEADIKILAKYPPQCCHIAAFKEKIFTDEVGEKKRTSHHLTKLSELDYLKRYPAFYFKEPMAIELENSIVDQLKVQAYLSSFKI